MAGKPFVPPGSMGEPIALEECVEPLVGTCPSMVACSLAPMMLNALVQCADLLTLRAARILLEQLCLHAIQFIIVLVNVLIRLVCVISIMTGGLGLMLRNGLRISG